jgi:surfactin synthase thioesterase subunit
MGTLPLVVIGHPLGGLRAEEVEARVREAAERLAALVAGPPPDRP